MDNKHEGGGPHHVSVIDLRKLDQREAKTVSDVM